MKMIKLIGMVAIGLLAGLQANAASFDCAKASTQVENIICKNYEISRLDDVLSTNYKSLLKAPVDADVVSNAKIEQKAWLQTRNECSNDACVRDEYIARNDAICETMLNKSKGPSNCISTSLAIQDIKKEEYDKSHVKTAAQAIQDSYEKHKEEVSDLGFSEAQLASGLYISRGPGSPYSNYISLANYLALLHDVDGFKSISKVDTGKYFGFRLKISGQPYTGFIFHVEDDEMYLNGMIQGDDVYETGPDIRVTNAFVVYAVTSMSNNGANL